MKNKISSNPANSFIKVSPIPNFNNAIIRLQSENSVRKISGKG